MLQIYFYKHFQVSASLYNEHDSEKSHNGNHAHVPNEARNKYLYRSQKKKYFCGSVLLL